ncbi:iron-sulfur cluster carrier protein ApbC [Aestuariivirga litoralis]|uniref:iron-sulfur cluster carrier protein ApbC n=1 Tax=Aestuariivirga litoralis TaxID=2650924 RepID=UPI0018C4CB0B|nr:iron-sulfur cluster carrier protein ApbC [Aestuariivirga litoralis]MBG1232286.1 iron-sulfur cluster carrier protein ApbC [Aestuariivirga litoralis]
MPALSQDLILAELKHIAAPDGRGNIVSAGLVSEIAIQDGEVMFALNVNPAHAKSMEQLAAFVQDRVSKIDGVKKARVVLTAERAPERTPGPKQQQAASLRNGIPGVKHLIAVASGKGGVGKSTTAINLALGFKANGLRVAVLDADVYGPSMPKLFGIHGKPEASDEEGKRMKPMNRFGVEVASIGFLVDEATPMIWRGPMVMSALTQLLREVSWGETDVMVIDMPPGTGDAQLTLAQQTPLSGAVIVSTPQDLALIDARKGLNMFVKVNVPVLGIIENMSYFICDQCGKRHEIFGHGGARKEAEKLSLPFLGEIPLDLEIRERSDAGEPIVASLPDSPHAAVYRGIAANIWARLEAGQLTKAPPRIVIE